MNQALHCAVDVARRPLVFESTADSKDTRCCQFVVPGAVKLHRAGHWSVKELQDPVRSCDKGYLQLHLSAS